MTKRYRVSIILQHGRVDNIEETLEVGENEPAITAMVEDELFHEYADKIGNVHIIRYPANRDAQCYAARIEAIEVKGIA